MSLKGNRPHHHCHRHHRRCVGLLVEAYVLARSPSRDACIRPPGNITMPPPPDIQLSALDRVANDSNGQQWTNLVKIGARRLRSVQIVLCKACCGELDLPVSEWFLTAICLHNRLVGSCKLLLH